MFTNPFRPQDPANAAALADAYRILDALDPVDDKEQYETTLAVIERLNAMKPTPIDLDINKMAAVAANILVAVIVIRHERTNVITTKVGSLLSKI